MTKGYHYALFFMIIVVLVALFFAGHSLFKAVYRLEGDDKKQEVMVQNEVMYLQKQGQTIKIS